MFTKNKICSKTLTRAWIQKYIYSICEIEIKVSNLLFTIHIVGVK